MQSPNLSNEINEFVPGWGVLFDATNITIAMSRNHAIVYRLICKTLVLLRMDFRLKWTRIGASVQAVKLG
jgi:hypothetical protein